MEIRFVSIREKTAEEIERMFASLPRGREEELRKMRSERVMLQSLAGEWLAREMLSVRTGIPAPDLPIVRRERQKPVLAGGSCCFNISHSGDWVMAAVSGRPVGVDLEARDRRVFDAVKRVCREEDWRYVEEAPPAYRKERMLELWTRKEALVKCTGGGIFAPEMREIVGSGEKLLVIGGKKYLLQNVAGPEGYCCAVCEER